MTYKTNSLSPSLHPLRLFRRTKRPAASGTLSPQDLRRIVAEMVG